MKKNIQIHKVGGQFFVYPKPIERLALLLSNLSSNTLIVISAVKGITRILESLVNLTIYKKSSEIEMHDLQKTNLYWLFENMHIDIISVLYKTPEKKKEIIKKFFAYFQQLKITIDNYESADKYFYSKVVKFGELVSSMILNEYLKSRGVKTILINAPDFITTSSVSNNNHFEFFEVKKDFEKLFLRKTKATLFLTQGFIASDTKGNPTTVGKGGSDYTAAICTVELSKNPEFNVKSLNYWKDVNGVYDKDPKKYTDAKIIRDLTYEEYKNFSSVSSVIRNDSIELVEPTKIPIYMRSFLNFFDPGTIIH